jgi:hypothetical protein
LKRKKPVVKAKTVNIAIIDAKKGMLMRRRPKLMTQMTSSEARQRPMIQRRSQSLPTAKLQRLAQLFE